MTNRINPYAPQPLKTPRDHNHNQHRDRLRALRNGAFYDWYRVVSVTPGGGKYDECVGKLISRPSPQDRCWPSGEEGFSRADIHPHDIPKFDSLLADELARERSTYRSEG